MTSTFILVLHPVEAEPTAWTVQGDSPADFSSIQDAPINYTLNIEVSGYGTTSPATGSHSYEEGSEIAVYATDSYSSWGWLFDYWLLDGSVIDKKNNPLNLVMDKNYELTAVFAQAPIPFPTPETTPSQSPIPEPTATPAPTPSPAASPEPHEIPEFPFWVTMPLFTIAALLVAIFQFNNRKQLT